MLQAFHLQVTWVEHAEMEKKPVHPIFDHYVNSGMAFGAKRWLAVLKRQCQRLASLMARNISDLGGTNFMFFVLLLYYKCMHLKLTMSLIYIIYVFA